MKRMMAVGLLVVALAAILPAPVSAAPTGWGGGGRQVAALVINAPIYGNGSVSTVPIGTKLDVVSVGGSTAVVSSKDVQGTVYFTNQWGKVASGSVFTYVPIANVCGEGEVCTPSFVPRPKGWSEVWVYTGQTAVYQRRWTEYVWRWDLMRSVPVNRYETYTVYGVREIFSGENGVTKTPW